MKYVINFIFVKKKIVTIAKGIKKVYIIGIIIQICVKIVKLKKKIGNPTEKNQIYVKNV